MAGWRVRRREEVRVKGRKRDSVICVTLRKLDPRTGPNHVKSLPHPSFFLPDLLLSLLSFTSSYKRYIRSSISHPWMDIYNQAEQGRSPCLTLSQQWMTIKLLTDWVGFNKRRTTLTERRNGLMEWVRVEGDRLRRQGIKKDDDVTSSAKSLCLLTLTGTKCTSTAGERDLCLFFAGRERRREDQRDFCDQLRS